METTIVIIGIIIIAALSALTAAVITNGRRNRDNTNNEEFIERLKQSHDAQIMQIRAGYAEQREEMRADFDRRLEKIESDSRKRTAELKEEYDKESERLREMQKEQLETLRREASNEYKALSQQVLEKNATSLKEQNLEQIDSILTPLKERIQEFHQIVIDSYTKENAARQSLTDQITNLIELNKTIGDEARNLTSALKSDSKVQGDWGETILKTLLEQSGLEEGIHFEVQATRDERGNILRDDEGNGLRPDVIVHLPDRKNIIIDSKVSLTSFAAYHSCGDPNERESLAKKHLASVKKHIKELSEKEYQKHVSNSAEHVLMFIPVENAYLMAIQLDPMLWKYAYDLHVAIVSPTHLFSVMQIISQLWSQDSRNRNAMKIAESGGRIYDKLAGFCDDFQKLRKALDTASASYDNALKKLSTGRGNIVSMAENMRTLGAKVKKSLPDEILSEAEISSIDSDNSTKKLGSFEE